MGTDQGDPGPITLSDGSPIWEDATIARGPLSVEQLLAIREVFADSKAQRLELSGDRLNECLPDPQSLGNQAAISLFTGLRQAGVATEAGRGRTYADYTFEVDTDPAVDLLDQQLVARTALRRVAERRPEGTDVRLVVSLPPHIRPDALDGSSVTRLGPRLRSMLFDAEESVRIANPYFDTSDAVIGDLASLPRRGVDTRMITRQVDTNERTAAAIGRVVEKAGEAGLGNLSVRDLYAVDEASGEHAYAAHAKVAISDGRRCYIGSANLMQTGLSANFELGVLLEGPLVARVVEVFDAVFDAAEPVTLPLGESR